MTSQKSKKAEDLLLKYLEGENILRKKITDPKIEFGYVFGFPTGQQRHPLQVIMPKDKDYITISLGVQIQDVFVQALDAIEPNKKTQFYIELRKFLLQNNLLFRLELTLNRYQITDQIYLEESGFISKDRFFKTVRKIYNSTLYCHFLMEEYCIDKIDKKYLEPSDLADPALYS
ncbi:MAG: DUF2299 family protein [Promethearchaeota archaeon]